MKYLKQLFFVLSILLIQNGNCQSTVYVQAGQFGRGILKMRGNECFVITPKHLIKDDYNGITNVYGEGSVRSRADFLKELTGDLAILRFSDEQHNLNCTEWQIDQNYRTIVDNVKEGYLELRDPSGESSKVSVKLESLDVQYITIEPLDKENKIRQGMSGSSLFVEYEGKKVYLGMLQAKINEKDKDKKNVEQIEIEFGQVIRADEMDKLLSSFFNPVQQLKKSRVISENIVIKEDLGFRFNLLDIEKSGNRATFNFEVTSLKNEKILYLRNGDIFLYDDKGLESIPDNIVLADRTQKYGYIEHNLIEDTPVSLKITFNNVSSSAQFATLFKIKFSDKITTSNIEFKDLPFGDGLEGFEEKENWSEETLGFKFDLLSFEKTGTDVVFIFTVTSLERDKLMKLRDRNILFYDNMGSEYLANDILLANSSQNYGYVNHKMIENLVVPLIISFKDVNSSATGVSKLQFGFSDEKNESSFEIMNLIFPEKVTTNSASNTANISSKITNKSAGKPTTTCSELYFYRKNGMLECPETVYLYNHGELLTKMKPGTRYKAIVCDDRSFKLSVRTNPNEIALSASKPAVEMGNKYYFKITCVASISTIGLQENKKGEKDISNNGKFMRKLAVLPLNEY